MKEEFPSAGTAGAAIFTQLRVLGIEYVFANSGTDFPPIIEGFAEAKAKNIAVPEVVIIPHEHAAMGMAHGYYLISGKMPAVMLHTNVGLANGAIGAINAACENIPLLLMSGRTPVSEQGRFGSRTVPIGWGQEMRDQGALVREACKWEYELRFPEQMRDLLNRASAIANSTPKGPVYLSLPREVLCEEFPESDRDISTTMAAVAGAPNPVDIQKAAQLLAQAKNPLVIAQRGAGDEAAFNAFAGWAKDWGMAVCSWWATHLAISTEHPCHIGADPGEYLPNADIVLVINSLAPWWPDKHKISPDTKVINMGPDPIFSRFPVRNFRSDISISGETETILPALFEAMKNCERDQAGIDKRMARIKVASADHRQTLMVNAAARNAQGITKAFVSKCLGKVLQGHKSSVFSELGTSLGTLERCDYKSWFQEPHSGGLGWSFPAALGAKLAEPDRICVATMGDGSYMFANPTVCHQIAEAMQLSILVIVLNNEKWGAVRASVEGMYPDGYAAKSNDMPLTALKPSPDFTLTAQASRAWTKEISRVDDVPDILQQALDVVIKDKRQVLLNIKIID